MFPNVSHPKPLIASAANPKGKPLSGSLVVLYLSLKVADVAYVILFVEALADLKSVVRY